MRRGAAILGSGAALLMATAPGALAQCAMCRTAAAAQAAQAGTLNTAILILLLPALALFSTVFLVAFRTPSSDEREDSPDR